MGLKKIKLTPLDILLYILWFLMIYGSTDGAGYSDNPTFLWTLFYNGFIIDNGFRIPELGIIIFSLFLLFHYKQYYKVYGFNSRYFLLIACVFILILINPNNNASFFEHFLANDSKFIILFTLFYISIIFLEEKIYTMFIIKCLKIGFIIILYKALSNFIFYLLGISQELIPGVPSTLPQSDVLYFTGLTVLMLVYFYLFDLKSHKKIIISIALFVIMLLSLRRTEIISLVIVLASVLIFNQIKFPEKGLNLKRIFQYALIPIAFIVIFNFTSAKFSSVLSRYISAFSYFDESLNNEEVKDSGHIEQSVNVTISMFNKLTFWGSGLQNEAFYLQGQSAARAHSNLAYAMAKQGLFVSIFFVYSFLIFLKELVSTISLNRKKYSREFILLRFMTASLLVNFYISGWASGNVLFDNYPQTYISYILIFSLFKLTPEGVNKLVTAFK